MVKSLQDLRQDSLYTDIHFCHTGSHTTKSRWLSKPTGFRNHFLIYH